MYKSRIKGGVIYGGSVAPGQWSRLLSATYGSALVMIFVMALFLSLPAPVDAFLAYDCANGTNPVEAYSLLEPARCVMTGEDHRYERLIQVEIIQQKKERTINVFRCHIVESVFSQYCGHYSAAGVTRYLKFREPLILEPEECLKAWSNDGNVTINKKLFMVRMGTTTSHSFFLSGSLDAGHNCDRGDLKMGSDSYSYQAAQSVLEITLQEEYGRINEATGTIKLPGGVQGKLADLSARDSLMGTTVWRYRTSTCLQGLTQLFRGSIKVFSNSSSDFVGAVALLEEKGQVAGLELKDSSMLCLHPAYQTFGRDFSDSPSGQFYLHC
jgi:hypothetical protein